MIGNKKYIFRLKKKHTEGQLVSGPARQRALAPAQSCTVNSTHTYLVPELCAVEAGVHVFRVADRRGSTKRGESRPAVHAARAHADGRVKLVPVHLSRREKPRDRQGR